MKKNEWRNPRVICLGIDSTKNDQGISPLDLGHGYDEYIHTHHCTCGKSFATWAAAQAHEKEMTLAGLSKDHNIGCDIQGMVSGLN